MERGEQWESSGLRRADSPTETTWVIPEERGEGARRVSGSDFEQKGERKTHREREASEGWKHD